MSHSPVAPTEKFIIVLRTSENVSSFPLLGWFTPNIVQLSKKFVTKTIKLGADFTPGTFHMKFSQMLQTYNREESLNLIGGFQDNKKQLKLLFFKTDARPTADEIERNEIFVENF